jgi:hypothetical protein
MNLLYSYTNVSHLPTYLRTYISSYAHRCTQGGGRGWRRAPHVPPIKIFENFHIKMQ